MLRAVDKFYVNHIILLTKGAQGYIIMFRNRVKIRHITEKIMYKLLRFSILNYANFRSEEEEGQRYSVYHFPGINKELNAFLATGYKVVQMSGDNSNLYVLLSNE